MNISIEGSDLTGKTTLSTILSNELERLIIKGSSFENATVSNQDLYNHFKKLSNVENAIIDRNIYSNRVYATLYKDYTILTDEQRHSIEDKMKQNKDIIIYLTAPRDILVERLLERGDEYIKANMFTPILEEYDKAMKEAVRNGLSVLSYDTSHWSSEDIAESIIEIITTKLKEE